MAKSHEGLFKGHNGVLFIAVGHRGEKQQASLLMTVTFFLIKKWPRKFNYSKKEQV